MLPISFIPPSPATSHVRWMIARDLPAVVEIERASFSHPWTDEDFRAALREHNVIGQVAEYGETVVGYMLYEMAKRSFRVVGLAVHPAWRRRGVGSRLLGKLASKLSEYRRSRMTAVLRETDLVGLNFFKASGFRAVGLLRGRFADTGEDGVDMRYRVRG